MTNRFFGREEAVVHPIARAWLERVRGGQKATVELWRKRDGLVFKPAKLYVTFETAAGDETAHDDWDIDLNDALVHGGVRAVSPENEAQRLSLMLRYWLSKPEERFGPGFFDAVLVEILAKDFMDRPAVVACLPRTHLAPASKEGHGYADCKEQIDAVIQRAADSLVDDLKYERSQAESILALALGHVLDERFHVTERQMLGWS